MGQHLLSSLSVVKVLTKCYVSLLTNSVIPQCDLFTEWTLTVLFFKWYRKVFFVHLAYSVYTHTYTYDFQLLLSLAFLLLHTNQNLHLLCNLFRCHSGPPLFCFELRTDLTLVIHLVQYKMNCIQGMVQLDGRLLWQLVSYKRAMM